MAGCLGSPFDLQQSRFVCKGNCLLDWAGNLSCSRPSWARKNSLRLPGSCAGGVHAAGNAEGLGGRKPGISMGGVWAGRERSTLLYTSTNVSWEQLDSQGLVFGTPVQIDGQFYLCRCLKVGAEDGVPNEWDTALDEAGENNMVWNWTNQYFWGRKPQRAGCRIVRFAAGHRPADGTTIRHPVGTPLSASALPWSPWALSLVPQKH